MTCFSPPAALYNRLPVSQEVAHGLIPLDKWRPERREVVHACRQVELEPAIGLLWEDLAVAQTELRCLIVGNGIVLHQAHAAEKAIRRDFAKRSGLEHGRRQS